MQGPTSGSIKFNTVITNIGGHYKQNTGYFICEQPGIYKFSVHILQSKLAAGAYCRIKKNETDVIWAYIEPSSNAINGWYGSSNSVILHLSHGDKVHLGSCTKPGTMDHSTSFSGFLINAD